MPAVSHTKEDVRNAAVKILIDTQKQTGQIIEADFVDLPEKVRIGVWEKVKQVEKEEKEELLEDEPDEDVLQSKVNVVNLQLEPANSKMSSENFERFKQIISEKAQHKDWTQREIALTTM